MTDTNTNTVFDSGSLLGQGSEFTGKLTFLGTVRIEGRFDGEIISKETLVIADGAEVSGIIQVDTLVVTGGTVNADITAATVVELHPPGNVSGTVTTPCFQIEKGAIFQGQSIMLEPIHEDR